MPAALLPPPEARLITELRRRPPAMSMREAAADAGISPTHWRQVETGIRRFRGRDYEETGTARTIARMALVVGGDPDQLTALGRHDAAQELEAMLEQAADVLARTGITERQKRRLASRWIRAADDQQIDH